MDGRNPASRNLGGDEDGLPLDYLDWLEDTKTKLGRMAAVAAVAAVVGVAGVVIRQLIARGIRPGVSGLAK